MTDTDQLLRSTVDEVMARHPAVIHVFNALGIDTCCGGGAPLAEAAKLAHVRPAALLASIEAAMRT